MRQLVVGPHEPAFPRNSEGDLIELKDGKLLLIWTQFYGGFADHSSARLQGRISADKGETWSAPFTVMDPPGGLNVMSVSILRNRRGQLLLFYLWKQTANECSVWERRSEDEGLTWKEPIPVSHEPGYHVMNNARVLLLNDGRILAPVAWTNSVFCYISDDDGDSWRKSTGYTSISDNLVMEPGLVELTDDRVMMIIRTELGYIYKAYSTDGGESWSEPTAMPLISPASPATITRIPSTGDLVVVWNNQPLGGKAAWSDRTPLTSAISRDEGITWECVKNIEENPERCFAYTSIDFIAGAAYLTYYEWLKGRQNFAGTDLKLTIIPQSWFYET